ncbi:hypothetical protein AAVH_29749 [Aphelenchoides avenae]|nr:hypothetical protein AAVH_29749 [Aphelenchus avenae]
MCGYGVSYTKAVHPRWCGGHCWSVWLDSGELDNVHGIYGPGDDIYKIAEFLNGKYDYERRAFEVVNCGPAQHYYPPIFFQVGLISLKLTAYDYIYKASAAGFDSYENKRILQGTSDNRCYLAFLPGEAWGSGFAKYWIIGTPFFNSHCLVVDFKRNLIGFADLK